MLGATKRLIAPVLALLSPLCGCQCGAGADPSPAPAASASAAPAESALAGAPAAPAESAAEAAPAEPKIVGASQILVAYKGAELAGPAVTRSRQEARKRADEALARLTDGKATFEELAQQVSDDPTRVVGGAMGNFERGAMPPAFSDAAFALRVGQTSGVVETARGFHIVRRVR
jgi:PPIC-type PPIASE domain